MPYRPSITELKDPVRTKWKSKYWEIKKHDIHYITLSELDGITFASTRYAVSWDAERIEKGNRYRL